MTPRPGLALGGRLDPGTGRWSRLPAATLETPEGGWSPVAVGPGSWAACWGLVYDVASGRVATLPGPDGAPDAGVTASWAGDRLLAFGGSSSGSDGSAVTNHAWLWSP
jgi:hypothetical protein